MTADVRSPLTKERGALKEQHEVELGIATPVFDIASYVEEFGASIVPAYRRGVADAEWPADVGLARSVIPPGTAATRDFSRLALRLPQLIAERCVGCMACVSACPDSAILGIAVPERELEERVSTFAAGEREPAVAALMQNAILVAHDVPASLTAEQKANKLAHERWELAEAIGFGGSTEHFVDGSGRLEVRWHPERTIVGVPYNILIPGYGGAVNTLRLWSARSPQEFNLQIFNDGDYFKAVEQKISSETISKVLYPSDAAIAGRELRLMQEYFLVACAVRDVVGDDSGGTAVLRGRRSRHDDHRCRCRDRSDRSGAQIDGVGLPAPHIDCRFSGAGDHLASPADGLGVGQHPGEQTGVVSGPLEARPVA